MASTKVNDVQVVLTIEGKKAVQEIQKLENANSELGKKVREVQNANKELTADYRKLAEEQKSYTKGSEDYDRIGSEMKKISAEIVNNKEEFKKLKNTIAENTQAIDDGRKAIGLQGLSYKQLKDEARLLYKELDKLTYGTKEFTDKAEEIKKVEARITAVKTEIKGISEEKGGIKDLISSFQALPIVVAAAFVISKVMEWGAAIDESARKINKLRGQIEQIAGITGESLDKATVSITALSENFGLEYDEILKAANGFSKQMGISVNEAISLIESGLVKGANANGDFLDKLSEYPQFFENAGYTAEEFIKIATQEVKGGVFSDKLLDSVKEINLRLSELSATQQSALTNAFGQSFTDDFVNKISSGSLSIKDGLKLIMEQADKSGLSVTQLQTLTADLGGGPVEDINGLGQAWKQLDKALNSTLESTTDYEKALEAQLKLDKDIAETNNEIAKALGSSQSQYSSISKVIQNQLLSVLLEVILYFQDLGKWVSDTTKPIQELFGRLYDQFSKAGSEGLSLKTLLGSLFNYLLLGFNTGISVAVKFAEGILYLYDNFKIVQAVAAVMFQPLISSAKLAINVLNGDFSGAFKSLQADAASFIDTVTFGLTNLSGLIEDTQAKTEATKDGIKNLTGFDAKTVVSTIQETTNKTKEEEETKKTNTSNSDAAIAAQQKANEEFKRLNEERIQNEADAEKQLEELRINAIKDTFEKQKAEINNNYKNLLQDFKGSESQKAEFEKLSAEERNNALLEIDRAKAEEQLNLIDQQSEAEQQKITEKYASMKDVEIQNYAEKGQALVDALAAETITREEFDSKLLEAKEELEANLTALEFDEKQLRIEKDIEIAEQKLEQELISEEQRTQLQAEIANARILIKENENQRTIDLIGKEAEFLNKKEDEKTAKTKEEQEKRLAKTKQTAKDIQSITQGLYDIANTLLNAESANIARAKEEELRLAGDNKEKQDEINKRYQAKEFELKRKKATLDKVNAITNIILNTAQGVASALTAGPIIGIILAGVVAGLGAVQLGVALSTPLPSYKKGGRLGFVREKAMGIIQKKYGLGGTMVKNYGVLPGNTTHEQGGLSVVDNKTGYKVAEFESQEGVIFSKEMMNNNAPIIDDILQSKGAPISGTYIPSSFAEGGLLNTSTQKTNNNTEGGSINQLLLEQNELLRDSNLKLQSILEKKMSILFGNDELDDLEAFQEERQITAERNSLA